MPQCIRCDKNLNFLPPPFRGEEVDQIDDGGNVVIFCHYGSVHDMCLDFVPGTVPYKSYICDDCFGKIKKRDEEALKKKELDAQTNT